MQLPAILKPFQKEGEELLKSGKVKQVEFSGSTYQVQVVNDQNQKDVWSFLQLNERNQLKDSFCSCDESEEVLACPHLAASYLTIFHHTKEPLHKRFEKSLWNQLFYLYSNRLNSKNFKESAKGLYAIYSTGGKQIFLIQGLTKNSAEQLKNLLFYRSPETEETSLKFSNLSQEELHLWKEGRPSAHLKYELSFWNDLAKWMMSLQDAGEKYEIKFDYSVEGLPNYITIQFPELFCRLYLSQANLPHIIPSLATVKSPLRVHSMSSRSITKITYDRKEGCLLIDSRESDTVESKEANLQGVRLGSWFYVPLKGFYPLDPLGLLSSKKIYGKDISHILNENLAFVKGHLEGEVIHEEPIRPSYTIEFDADWNLHIKVYVHTPGDLSYPGSKFFDDWIFLENEGFYKLESPRFQAVDTMIASHEVGDFIQQHRVWLNLFPGFETHLASLESQLTYTMASVHGPLSFERTMISAQENERSRDFGPWIYIAGQGFYAKVKSLLGLPIRSGTSLNADQIPLFIRMNREELKIIPGFFSETSPIASTSLKLTLTDDEQIHIEPFYEKAAFYQDKEVAIFDEFVYVKGEGFSELPALQRLPVNYRSAVTIEKNEQDNFLLNEFDRLKPLFKPVDQRLERPNSLSLVAHQISRPAESSKSWYEIQLGYQSALGEIPISQLYSALRKKQRFCFSEAGLIDLRNKRFDWLNLLDKKRLDKKSNTLTLSTIELIRLNAFDSIEVLQENEKKYQNSIALLKELTEFQIPEEPILKGLNCSLRSYQTIGLNWLWFLYHQGLSGLLCDDMGLGKTHQAMALLAAIINFYKNKEENSNRHFLIICPTSVIYHWQDKLSEFLPELRICTFYGSQRSLKEFKEQYDILLTSYGIWRIEHEMLSQYSFEVAIFDEVQLAKNHNSRLHTSLTQVNSHMRLGLTGTPIENHLRELKSLFDLTLPTYMPGEKDYRDYFVKPIEKRQDPERQALLSRLIHPFVLRRKKEDVLLDLPEKTEEVSHCGLAMEQARLYNDVVERSRKIVLDELSHTNQPIPYIHIFSILSSLKQICDHPACYFKEPDKYKHFQSGKWDLFVELLSEARESHQKVVVFSQYLHMLDIIQNHLKEAKIDFATIRGSTSKRGEQLKRFNEDPKCEVFVGSLQASGLGVELTAASVVIHYDRWWNAARENQATDRVHRLGQTRGVQVFKLVTKDTFEEKIDAMISRKGKLMDIVGVDDHRLLKNFNRDEIIDLFQSVPF